MNQDESRDLDPDEMVTYERIKAVQSVFERELMAKSNVVGVAIGLRRRGGVRTNEMALVVLVSRKMPRDQLSPDDVLPDELDSIPVDVQEVGEITARG